MLVESFQSGDDFVKLSGDGTEAEYWDVAQRDDFDHARPSDGDDVPRCTITNLSQSPVIAIQVFFQTNAPQAGRQKIERTFPFSLAASSSHRIWFVTWDAEPIDLRAPFKACVYQVPDLSRSRETLFERVVRDLWTERSDRGPYEHLDESM